MIIITVTLTLVKTHQLEQVKFLYRVVIMLKLNKLYRLLKSDTLIILFLMFLITYPFIRMSSQLFPLHSIFHSFLNKMSCPSWNGNNNRICTAQASTTIMNDLWPDLLSDTSWPYFYLSMDCGKIMLFPSKSKLLFWKSVCRKVWS